MKIKSIKKLEPVQNKSFKEHVDKALTLNEKDKQVIRDMAQNASLMRANLLNKLIDSRRDIDDECGYPKSLTTAEYKMMYDREGIATRIVSLFPEECWSEDPMVSENNDPSDTVFEKAYKDLDREKQLFSYMAKIDELSGIGRYGILLLGIDDGKELDQPVDGINERGEKVGKSQYKLLYLRALDESCIDIKSSENNSTNPRFGKPTMYGVTFEDASSSLQRNVHWTRVIHIADNRKNSEVFGTPRMQTVFNRLYDLRKIAGGSGEMFWKGGFPGYAFEMDPNSKVPTIAEADTMRNNITEFANGLQRYIRLQGVKVNSLNPQVADPKAHVDVQLELIAITMGVPKRIFMGSEQAKLASEKDSESWNKRVRRRQKKYLSTYLVRLVIDRLIALGVLPEPEKYDIVWPDLDSPSDKDKAEVLKAEVEAFSKYVGGNVDSLISPEVFFKMFVGLNAEEIKEIMDAVQEREKDLALEEENQQLHADDEQGDKGDSRKKEK